MLPIHHNLQKNVYFINIYREKLNPKYELDVDIGERHLSFDRGVGKRR